MNNSRLILWRKAIFLFRRQYNFEGPFAQCGYTQFLIEQKINESEIDILAWNPKDSSSCAFYYILELTTNPHPDKEEQLKKYTELGSSNFVSIGIQSTNCPNIMLVTSSFVEGYEEYCQLELGTTLITHHIDKIYDSNLVEALQNQINLDKVPQTSFTIVPECNDHELKLGLVDSIMMLFSPKCESMSANEITDIALDFIADKISLDMKEKLISRVSKILHVLSKTDMKKYIVFEGNTFTLTEDGKKVAKYPNSREFVQKKLMEWAKGTVTTLDQWY